MESKRCSRSRAGFALAAALILGTLAGIARASPALAQGSCPTSTGNAGVACVSPMALYFGEQTVQTPSEPKSIFLTNTGAGDLHVMGVTFEPYASDPVPPFVFAVSNECPSTLPPGAACAINVTFDPAFPRDQSGLIVPQTDGIRPAAIVVSGTGVPSGLSSPLSATTHVLDFGDTSVGSTSGELGVDVTNNSSGPVSLPVTESAGQFRVVTNTCAPPSPPVGPGGSCSITVRFEPASPGQQAGIISLDNGLIYLLVAGTGVAVPIPDVSLEASPSSLSFPDTPVDNTSAPQTVQVTNAGSKTATITSVTTTSSQFTVDAASCAGRALAHNDQCSFSVAFSPSTEGEQSGDIQIAHDLSPTPLTIAVTGHGGVFPPAASFQWRAGKRFGTDSNLNGLIDEPNSWDYVHYNGQWQVTLDPCASRPGSAPLATFTWNWAGEGASGALTVPALSYQPPPGPPPPGPPVLSCTRSSVAFPHLEGTYTVTLTVTDTAGRSSSTSQVVHIRNLLVASLGDSYASGEGAPERPQVLGPAGVVEQGPTWADGDATAARCHRSTRAAPAQAALTLESRDPHSVVTFIHLACSGALTTTGLLKPQYKGWSSQIDTLAALACNTRVNPSQLCPPGPRKRLDALIISIGGNDMRFSDIIKACLTDVTVNCFDDSGLLSDFHTAVADMPRRYDKVADRLHRVLAPNIYLTEYPDITTNARGGWQRLPGLLAGINAGEARWASQFAGPTINSSVASAARDHGWHYLAGSREAFIGHGVAAGDQRWINTMEDSIYGQGPCVITCDPLFSTPLQWVEHTGGVLHPNPDGSRVWGQIIAARLIKDLLS